MLIVDKIIEDRCNVLIGSAEMPVVQRYNLIYDILQFERVHNYWEVMLTKSSWEDVISEGFMFSSQVACYSIRHIDCLVCNGGACFAC